MFQAARIRRYDRRARNFRFLVLLSCKSMGISVKSAARICICMILNESGYLSFKSEIIKAVAKGIIRNEKTIFGALIFFI